MHLLLIKIVNCRSNGYKSAAYRVIQFNCSRSRGWLNHGGELSTSSTDVNDVNALCFRAIYSNRTFP